jgi:acyl carrier protein
MTPIDPEVRDEILVMISELAEDWEYEGELRPETRFLEDMGLESLDIVVIGTMLQHRYGRLPFTEWLAEIGERPPEERDVTVSELVAFVCQHREPAAVEGR